MHNAIALKGKEKRKGRGITCLFLFFLVIAMFSALCFANEIELMIKDGEPWATVKGELVKVDMSAIKGVYEEYAVRQKDDELVILIGEKVSELEGKIGNQIVVSGVLKPRLIYAGTPTRTLEIREINK